MCFMDLRETINESRRVASKRGLLNFIKAETRLERSELTDRNKRVRDFARTELFEALSETIFVERILYMSQSEIRALIRFIFNYDPSRNMTRNNIHVLGRLAKFFEVDFFGERLPLRSEIFEQ